MKLVGSIARGLSPVLQWVYKGYASKTRTYHRNGMIIKVLPGVFNPFLFYSSKDLVGHIQQNYSPGRILELGCGSAYLSLRLAASGWMATASDYSNKAIENARLNAHRNGINLEIIKSDLFENINTDFDLIAINPPYYEGKAQTEDDLAWRSGEHHAYFRQLFPQLAQRKANEKILMILSDQVDIQTILEIATHSGLSLTMEKEIPHLIENEIIYSVDRV